MRDAELDDGDVLAAVRRKVPVIDVEVVQPFVDQPTLILVEVTLERVPLLANRAHTATEAFKSARASGNKCTSSHTSSTTSGQDITPTSSRSRLDSTVRFMPTPGSSGPSG